MVVISVVVVSIIVVSTSVVVSATVVFGGSVVVTIIECLVSEKMRYIVIQALYRYGCTSNIKFI